MTTPNPPRSPARQTRPAKPATIMGSLGAFFGHIAKAVRTDVTKPPRAVVRREVQEKIVETPQGVVKLRRITTDEIEPVRRPPAPPPSR